MDDPTVAMIRRAVHEGSLSYDEAVSFIDTYLDICEWPVRKPTRYANGSR